MSYSFFIIGGDLRMFYLACNLSSDGNKVKLLGFEKMESEKLVNNNLKKAHSINDVEKKDILICSVPLTLDGENIYAPYSNNKIKINTIKNRKIITGRLTDSIKGWDILKDEKTSILNTVPTAEGAISKAIEESERTLFNENVLVLGYGRVGKILCDRLAKIGAKVYCEARKSKDLAYIEAYGYKPIHLNQLNENLCKMKVIFNTIPTTILDKSRIILLKKDTLIIDLASGGDGVDFESCRKQKVKAIHYLGIPGKVAPKTTAKYIKEYVYRIAKEM